MTLRTFGYSSLRSKQYRLSSATKTMTVATWDSDYPNYHQFSIRRANRRNHHLLHQGPPPVDLTHRAFAISEGAQYPDLTSHKEDDKKHHQNHGIGIR